MKLIFSLLGVLAMTVSAATAQVKTGIEVLRDNGFEQLKGKRVGLITNPTGIDSKMVSTIDILNAAEGVELKALYSPEHGVRGDVTAGGSVTDYIDSRTGVKVYSIYGNTLKPTPEMLEGLDALVYDRTESYANAVNAERNYNITYKQLSALTEKEQQNATNELVDTLGPSAGSIRALAEEVITNGDNINKGAKNFFKDTTSQGQNLSSAMMLIGEAAGVTSNTIAIAGDMTDNSVLRLSFTQDDVTGDPRVNENGAVWVKYFHNSRDLDGVDTSLGSFDSDSDFDGVTVGLDIMQYNNMQAGIAFSYGKGDSDGMGIENDFDMWGVNLYGNYKTDYLNFIADIGYSESDNELDGHVLGKKVEADRDVSVITAGLRAETIYTLNNVQFVPYTGIRYYNINPDDYTSKYDGQNAFKYDSDRLNVWTLPLGTSVRGEFAFDNGLKITPQAEVAYIFAFGDTDDNDVDVSMGTAAASSLKYSVMDDGSFLGNLGLEIGYNSFNFGLGYSYQKGSDAEANNWYVNAEYSF